MSLESLYVKDRFFEEAEKYIKNIEPNTHCMMAIDVEHFRLYQAIYGEEKAKILLREIANVLKQFQTEYGGVAGYLELDDFAVVTVYDKEVLSLLQQKIRMLIRSQNSSTGYPPAYGIYVITDTSESIASMYHCATVALSYVIGNYTSHSMEYYPDMDGKAEAEVRLLTEIQEGIEKDEFTFYIQPQYDINKQKIVGGESLVRWISAKRGFVSPGEFIPLLEKNGFIADLDQIIWEKVCKWLRACIDKGYEPVPISINVSRMDIFALDVPEFLVGLINKYEISPELIKIEITESAYAEEGDVIIQTANALKEHGFLVMMDDFGSGYSSLNMLKSMPVDVIKMDMRFLEINEQEEDDKGIGIIESVVNMARQMRIPIVVEGVETKTQENLLRKVGCVYTQGYFYYRPMMQDSFEELISDERNLDHNGFWYRQAESVHLREFLDDNLFTDSVVNNILGPAVFYDMYENMIEITRVNSPYFALAGIAPDEEESYRKRFWNSVRDDDRQLLYSIFSDAYEKQSEGASGYIHFVRRDGKILWVNIKVFFLREKDGHKLFYASLRDMTELKHQFAEIPTLKCIAKELTEEQLSQMDLYYGNLPYGCILGKLILDEKNKPIEYEIHYVNQIISKMSGGDIQRLLKLIESLMFDKKKAFLEEAYQTAYEGEATQMSLYSSISNRYFDIYMNQYQEGYVLCTLRDATRARIYEDVSNHIMTTFREVYILQLQENYCRKVYPEDDDMLDRGNYEEMVNRHFENGRIVPYDEENVREFLSLENIRKALRKQDHISYRYKRTVRPAGDEWCQVEIHVSKRKNGIPMTASMTIRSIEVLMHEKEDKKRQNMAVSLASMSDGFFVYNAAHDEKIVFANSPVIRMFGCKNMHEFREHVNGSFRGLVYKDDLERVEWEIIQQQKSSDKNLDFIRYRIMRKNGEIRWIEDVGYLETSNQEEVPEMYYVFVSDITDTMTEAQKKQLIRESEQFREAERR